MRCANIYFSSPILFAVKDDTGNVPGNPVQFDRDKAEETLYLQGETYGQDVAFVELQNDVSALGTPVWTLTNIQGSSVSNLRVRGSSASYRFIAYSAIVSAGDTTATLTCTAGAYSASIDVIIHVSDITVPNDIDTPAFYTGQAATPIQVPRPVLLPAQTDLDGSEFEFYFGWNEDFENHASTSGNSASGYEVTFDEPGYYRTNVHMSCANVYIRVCSH